MNAAAILQAIAAQPGIAPAFARVIAADPELVGETMLGTTLIKEGVKVATVEPLSAAWASTSPP